MNNSTIDEKIITNDILAALHTAISLCTYSIQQANNKDFRDTLVKQRDKFEDYEWDLYCFAKQKKYYIPAAPAGEADVEQVKQAINS